MIDTAPSHLISIVLLAIIHLAVIVRSLLVESRNSYSRAAWLLILLLLPMVGIVAYTLFGEPWVARQFQRRARKVFRELERHEGAAEAVLQNVPNRFHAAFRVCERIGHWSVVGGNSATLAADSNAAIDSMV
ncbi:MAG TPA: PLDc N-terminal domain-containing protein, partial [Bordetella sp.]|uniref:PLDc N-terminal domain-containing protein n=1 Tax=Bordetella sp. TaxID=28081 RepID=UPI002ED34E2B